jgi:hypothetical protein
MTYVTSVWEKGWPKNWVDREKPVTYKELLCIVGQKLLAVCHGTGGVGESQTSPLQVEPVGGEDERVESENQDDGEGQDKDKIDGGGWRVTLVGGWRVTLVQCTSVVIFH